MTQRPDDRIATAAPAVVVTLSRDQGEARTGTRSGGEERPAALGRLDAAERDWGSERVVDVRLQVPTGAEQLERMDLSGDEAAHVIQRALDRAYPFLEQEGLRNNFLYAARGKALDVQILVPEKFGWTRDQLRSPQFQQRFLAGFHQALAQIGPSRIGPAKAPLLPGLVRGVAAARQLPQIIRQAEQDPERVAKDLVRAAFSKLSQALPKPFRLMHELGRTVSRFRSRGE